MKITVSTNDNHLSEWRPIGTFDYPHAPAAGERIKLPGESSYRIVLYNINDIEGGVPEIRVDSGYPFGSTAPSNPYSQFRRLEGVMAVCSLAGSLVVGTYHLGKKLAKAYTSRSRPASTQDASKWAPTSVQSSAKGNQAAVSSRRT